MRWHKGTTRGRGRGRGLGGVSEETHVPNQNSPPCFDIRNMCNSETRRTEVSDNISLNETDFEDEMSNKNAGLPCVTFEKVALATDDEVQRSAYEPKKLLESEKEKQQQKEKEEEKLEKEEEKIEKEEETDLALTENELEKVPDYKQDFADTEVIKQLFKDGIKEIKEELQKNEKREMETQRIIVNSFQKLTEKQVFYGESLKEKVNLLTRLLPTFVEDSVMKTWTKVGQLELLLKENEDNFVKRLSSEILKRSRKTDGTVPHLPKSIADNMEYIFQNAGEASTFTGKRTSYVHPDKKKFPETCPLLYALLREVITGGGKFYDFDKFDSTMAQFFHTITKKTDEEREKKNKQNLLYKQKRKSEKENETGNGAASFPKLSRQNTGLPRPLINDMNASVAGPSRNSSMVSFTSLDSPSPKNTSTPCSSPSGLTEHN